MFGDKDFNYEANLEYLEHLKKLNIPFEHKVVPGVPHSAKLVYEKEGLRAMKFHAENFRDAQQAEKTDAQQAEKTSAQECANRALVCLVFAISSGAERLAAGTAPLVGKSSVRLALLDPRRPPHATRRRRR